MAATTCCDNDKALYHLRNFPCSSAACALHTWLNNDSPPPCHNTGSDWCMWSVESKAQKSRYTSDNNSTWLQTGTFLIVLKIWQQNASGFRRYGNYPREVTAPAIICWGTMSHARCTILISSLELSTLFIKFARSPRNGSVLMIK